MAQLDSERYVLIANAEEQRLVSAERDGYIGWAVGPKTHFGTAATPEIAHGGLTPNRSPESPPRRFHTIHDAAAWIQHNGPDFDLKTTYRVTRRDER